MFPEHRRSRRACIMQSAPLEREGDVLRRAVSVLQERLPRGWTAVASYDVPTENRRRIDAIVEVTGPDQSRVRLVAECKRAVVRRDLPVVLEQLESARASVPSPTMPLLVSRYLSDSARTWLDENDVSYVDATGNLRLVSRDPAVYLRDRGADKDPWRGPGRPRGTLRGEPAARVVRALADFCSPMPVTALVKRSGASTGATYRVLDFLEQEALVTRGTRGVVEQVRWRQLLERWSEDYGFQRDNVALPFLQPRGLPAVLTALAAASGLTYAVTGSLAATRWAAYADPRLASLYVDDVAAAAELLGLREVDSGANVLLAAPASSVVFDRGGDVDGVRYAAPSQVAVDLLTGPGRSPAEGKALLDWMEGNEPAWRK
jgi:hypothetical protein